MNRMNLQDLQPHVTILGWLYIVGHAVFLIIGLLVFVLLTGIGLATGEPEARTVLGIVGTAVGLLLTALAVPGLVAGYGLLARKSWARVLALVVGMLGLVNVPVGTAIGVYAVWILTQDAAAAYFAASASPDTHARLP
jgi:hypothetical protein